MGCRRQRLRRGGRSEAQHDAGQEEDRKDDMETEPGSGSVKPEGKTPELAASAPTDRALAGPRRHCALE